MQESTDIGGEVPTNDAETLLFPPKRYLITIKGAADFLFHRWSVEGVKEKAAATKNSTAKKTDDLESYVWRDPNGLLCLPAEHLRMALATAAKSFADPRSPRKSAMDLFRAGIVVTPPFATFGTDKWDYEDTRRVTIQRNGINRTRPAMRAGWEATFNIDVLLPEYITSTLLHNVAVNSGRFNGVGDFRPSYGRFNVITFKELV